MNCLIVVTVRLAKMDTTQRSLQCHSDLQDQQYFLALINVLESPRARARAALRNSFSKHTVCKRHQQRLLSAQCREYILGEEEFGQAKSEPQDTYTWDARLACRLLQLLRSKAIEAAPGMVISWTH